MTNYEYLIIGGGMTAAAAVDGIREIDSKGEIALISMERDAPYDRPPLTKGLWKGKPLDSIWRKTKELGVELHLGRIIRSLDVQGKRATDDEGLDYTYDRLLLATGGIPRQLPFGLEQIIYYRTLQDYERLRALAEKGRKFAVIGGGFIGAEIAAALTMIGKQVTMIFPDDAIGAHIFPRDLALFLNDFYREKGVELWPGESAADLQAHGDLRTVETKSGRKTVVDGVIAGIGIQPNVELAQMAGLRLDNGIVVDEFLRTSNPDIYAAGDVAAFYNPALGKRMRVEHEDNANTMGE